MNKLPICRLWMGLAFMIAPCVDSAELAATKDDTALPVANHLILSPDGKGAVRLLPIENIREDIDVFTPHRALLFTNGNLIPYVAYASESGNRANLGSWTGSSKYAVMLTGQHNQQYLAVIYPEDGALRARQIDLMPVWEYGETHLKWDMHAMAHDAILEVIPGKGDSVIGLFWRTANGKAFAVPVFIRISDSDKPVSVSFEFGERVWVEDFTRIPTLEKLGFK